MSNLTWFSIETKEKWIQRKIMCRFKRKHPIPLDTETLSLDSCIPKFLSQQTREISYKTLGTSIIYSTISPDSLVTYVVINLLGLKPFTGKVIITFLLSKLE